MTLALVRWWRRRRRGPAAPLPSGHPARKAVADSRRDLDATRDLVDTWTSDVRRWLGG